MSSHPDDSYVPAPGNEGPLPSDLQTAHIRHDVEVWTDTDPVCLCSSFALAQHIAKVLREGQGA